jgi:hypothetical protein
LTSWNGKPLSGIRGRPFILRGTWDESVNKKKVSTAKSRHGMVSTASAVATDAGVQNVRYLEAVYDGQE